MKATNVTYETLSRAAEEIGVNAEIEPRGKGFRVKLLPLTRWQQWQGSKPRRWDGPRGDSRYQRESVGTAGRRVYAVCWHGFRDYFRAVYRLEPNAIFYTAIATWHDRDDFEARHTLTGHLNVGSQVSPVAMVDACRCPEKGRF